ncbi:MAG: hypothetical protein ACI4BB_00190 [Coprococcus sp.]
MASTLKVNSTNLTKKAKNVKLFLREYEAQYKRLKNSINALNLDAGQLQALQASADEMYGEFQKMKRYLESGVIDIFETAAVEYQKADAVK